MKPMRLVLENSLGQVSRSVLWSEETFEVVLCLDSRRLEIVKDSSELKNLGRNIKVLKRSSIASLEKRPIALTGFGKLRLGKDQETFSPSVAFQDEESLDLFALTKWTTAAHVGTVLAILLVAFLFKPKPSVEDQVVFITPQDRVETKAQVKPKTVPVSERRIQPQRKKTQAKVSDRTTAPKRTQMKTTKQPQPKRPVAQRTRDLSKVGALGALGGTQQGSSKQGGLNLQARNNSSGSGKSGWGGVGGVDSTQPGRGIVASQVGNNRQAQGAGGYGTRGKGGGRSGYGNTQFAGLSGGYTLPLEEEALIQGGLDRDQVAAVIQRHIGQVIYCYEQGLQSQPSLSGRVTMDFVISGNGRVRTANVANTSLRSRSVENCIAGKLRNWTFPKPQGAVDVRVSYPFVLRRVGQG